MTPEPQAKARAAPSGWPDVAAEVEQVAGILLGLDPSQAFVPDDEGAHIEVNAPAECHRRRHWISASASQARRGRLDE
jgi:hypothetical protein